MDIELWKRQKKELKLTYDKIAELSGVPKSTVVDIFLQNTNSPRINNVEAIEKVLKIAPEQVEGYVYGLTDDEKVLIENYRRLRPNDKLIILKMLMSVFEDKTTP